MSINFECQQKCSSCFSDGLEQVINEYVTKIYSPGDKPNGAIKILIVPLCNGCENRSGKCWDNFEKAFLNGREKLNNYAGILFFTFENSVKGDFAGSIFNKSRMLREFFMCSVPAVTCDYSNILDGIKKLLIKIRNSQSANVNKSADLGKLVRAKLVRAARSAFENWNGKNGCEIIEDLSNIYACSEFHTRKTHTSLRKISEMLEDSSSSVDFKKKFKEEYYDVRKKYDIASIIASNPLRYGSLKILVIDDNPSTSRLEEDFKKVLKFFPANTEIHILKEDEYRKFLEADLWKKLLKRDTSAEIKVKILNLVNKTQIKEKNDRQTFFDKNGKFVYTHIVVDLLIDDYNFGNRIIRELVKFRSYVDTDESREPVIFDIFVYSLSDDIEDITRAFDEGARGYIWKFGRIYSLPALIAKTEDGREKIFGKRKSSVFWKTRNFGKLYHLPHTVIRKLQFTAFLEPIKDCNDEQELQQLMEISKKLSRKWIKDIPKAELHFHLGGAMDEDLIFNLAVNTVRHIMKKGLEKKTWERGEKDENFEKVRAIVKEYADNYKQHFEKAGSQGSGNNRGETGSKTLQDWLQSSGTIEKLEEKIKDLKFFPVLWETFDQEIKKNNSCTEQNKAEHPGKIIEDWLYREKNLFKEKDKHKKIETVLNDSPEDVFQILSFYIKEYCRIKVSKDDLISLFLVELGNLEGRKQEEIETFWKDTLIFLDENDRVIQEIKGRMKKEMNLDNLYCVANFLSDECSKCFQEFNKLGEPKKGLIRSLINARERGSDKSKGLAEYMIGSAFTGACHLQYYENIVAAVAYLVRKWVGDCVRYLEIRCSPTGYTSKELDLDRAVQALFDGADGMSRYLYLKKGEFIWTNFIISAKRHKSPYTMAQDIATVVMKRKLATKQDDEDINVLPERLPVSLYQWKRSKIVGIDLAGLETGFRASSFVEDFAPIFKVCSFLTIHAGEEDTEQSIWEAVYKLHANRIGHGLSLKNHPFLMEMARDLQICMELCPTSNCMTRIFKEEDHPFYIYVTEGLNVTINTDDPAWSGTVLSDEYVKAGELYYLAQKDKSEDEKQPLSLWDVLRIVKHGFKSAFISRKEKRTLLRSVEEEVYQKVLWKESVEFSLPELDEK